MGALETTFRMIKAETQLLYSSDYPHWDFDLPSTIYDLPFLSETAKRNILGGNARELFGLELGAKLGEGGVKEDPTPDPGEQEPGRINRGGSNAAGRYRCSRCRRALVDVGRIAEPL